MMSHVAPHAAIRGVRCALRRLLDREVPTASPINCEVHAVSTRPRYCRSACKTSSRVARQPTTARPSTCWPTGPRGSPSASSSGSRLRASSLRRRRSSSSTRAPPRSTSRTRRGCTKRYARGASRTSASATGTPSATSTTKRSRSSPRRRRRPCRRRSRGGVSAFVVAPGRGVEDDGEDGEQQHVRA